MEIYFTPFNDSSSLFNIKVYKETVNRHCGAITLLDLILSVRTCSANKNKSISPILRENINK